MDAEDALRDVDDPVDDVLSAVSLACAAEDELDRMRAANYPEFLVRFAETFFGLRRKPKPEGLDS